jgi:hypothetical protein
LLLLNLLPFVKLLSKCWVSAYFHDFGGFSVIFYIPNFIFHISLAPANIMHIQHREIYMTSLFSVTPFDCALLVIHFVNFFDLLYNYLGPTWCQRYSRPTSITLLCVSLFRNSISIALSQFIFFICFWIFILLSWSHMLSHTCQKTLSRKLSKRYKIQGLDRAQLHCRVKW